MKAAAQPCPNCHRLTHGSLRYSSAGAPSLRCEFCNVELPRPRLEVMLRQIDEAKARPPSPITPRPS
jgi:hypothetical protein